SDKRSYGVSEHLRPPNQLVSRWTPIIWRSRDEAGRHRANRIIRPKKPRGIGKEFRIIFRTALRELQQSEMVEFSVRAWLPPKPPPRIVIATGPEGSAYEEDGKRYRPALAKAGVEVQLRSTAGSVETAALLRDPHSGVSRCRVHDELMGRAGDTAAPRRRARCAFRLSPRRRVR